MRGTLNDRHEESHYARIIPADAGNTLTRLLEKAHREDHPRGCGEHRLHLIVGHVISGSSPRMRGTHDGKREVVTLPRIIPADAGNTMTRMTRWWMMGDHPRGCGEHMMLFMMSSRLPGSSPRMRGTLDVSGPDTTGLWIIPADAGNTSCDCGCPALTRDHPRGCGEHAKLMLNNLYGKGSSPRMRGTPKVVSDNQPFVRIIPADAGNTHRGLCGKRPGQDHPRGCGEHASGMESCLTTRGSSPRMRGTLSFLPW